MKWICSPVVTEYIGRCLCLQRCERELANAEGSMSSALFTMLLLFMGWMVARRRKDTGKTLSDVASGIDSGERTADACASPPGGALLDFYQVHQKTAQPFAERLPHAQPPSIVTAVHPACAVLRRQPARGCQQRRAKFLQGWRLQYLLAHQGNKVSKMNTLISLITVLTLSQFSISALAFNSQKEAGIPGAFCECNEADAFPGMNKVFTRSQLKEIQEKYETVDRRRPIDRSEDRYKQLDAIGQIVTERTGFGTGVLIPGNYVLTNAHVAMTVGNYVTFNIGQTHGDSRWADSITGKVVTKGSYAGSIPEDWSLVALDESRVDANKKYGSISPRPLKDIKNLREASETGLLMTAGFPGFKEPRWLWGEIDVKVVFDKEFPDTLRASSSSGMSGGAVLVEFSPGKFSLIGLVKAAGENKNQVEMLFKNGFRFDRDVTKFVNFLDPVFAKDFKEEYKRMLTREQ